MTEIRHWLQSGSGKALLGVLCLLLLAPASGVALSGFVLCVEQDGSVALEFTAGSEASPQSEPDCSAFLGSASNSRAGSAGESLSAVPRGDSHCIGCRDISLSADGATTYLASRSADDLHLTRLASFHFDLGFSEDTGRWASSVRGTAPRSRSHRSDGPHISVPNTVLLI